MLVRGSGLVLCSLLAFFGVGGNLIAKQAEKGVQVTEDEAQRRVDITIDGQPFTSYLWPTSLKKPVLFPLIAPGGTVVTRGYPLTPHAGERVDHPHHAGMWFNYGNVNGFDFWNNSDAIKPENRSKMGSIHQEKILSAKSGRDRGELVVESVWITGTGEKILDETTQYVFATRGDARVIDQITTLNALDHVVFNDDKEGLLGIRVASWLESPTEKGGVFTDANGNATKVDNAGSPGASGIYLTSEGKRGDQAWGTRGRWCTLTGTTDNKVIAIAILDHPENPGYPTYWHARGYGLFAANPLGRKIFDPSQTAFDYTIDKGQAATFRYRVLLYPRAVTPEEINREADTFAADYH
jgi:Methane oxygenase PmoA